jgi:hypothetical protein
MSDVLKTETTRLAFSMLFLVITILVMWIAYPKLMARAGKTQAREYWKAEREANEQRLFGGE